MIKRETYLKKIRPFYEQDIVKVISGIRRCGKSVILKQIIDDISNNRENHGKMIYINFELIEYSFIRDFYDLYQYIESLMDDNVKNYVFIDEIQYVSQWEKTINSLKAKYGDRISIFITGSNSNLLSGELATLLSGRYVSFQIYPLSFSESILIDEYKKNRNDEELFLEYMKWGGLPQRFYLLDEDSIRSYLRDVYNSIMVKDVITRFKITDLDLFNRIVEYISTTPSQTFSPESLSSYLINKCGKKVSTGTIYNYLEYMRQAFFIQKADRYDVRGKRILNGKYKYYLTDLGLGQILNSSKKEQIGAYLENVVYNELLYRGYDVKIGSFSNREIDFVAKKGSIKEYYQVTYYLIDDNVIDREFGAYKNIPDNYPKFVLSMDKFDMSRDGIIHRNIIDWLNEKQ